MRRTRAPFLILLAVAAACSPSSSELGEVAAELRALRLQVRSAPVESSNRPQVAEAMAPLRVALDGLLATQRDLQAQQLELAREMQRWSQLASESASANRAEDGKALAARLQELERKMASQEARHREVEELLRGALDRTSEQLDSFLRQLQSVPNPSASGQATPSATPTGASTGTPNAPAMPTSGATERSGGPKTEDPKRGGIGDDRVSRSLRGVPLGWWILLASSLLVGSTLFLRAVRRRGVSDRAVAALEPPTVPSSTANAPTSAPAGALQTTEEIWAAAALLGEAVDRLRRGNDPGQAPARANALAAAPGDLDFAGVDDLDLFVVEGLEDAAEADSAHSSAPAAEPPIEVPRPFAATSGAVRGDASSVEGASVEKAPVQNPSIHKPLVVQSSAEVPPAGALPMEIAPPESAAAVDSQVSVRMSALRSAASSAATNAKDSGGVSRPVESVLPRRAPAQLSFRLRARDPANACSALLKMLREDPRVLQRPEPRVHGAGPEVLLQFAVLPGLPAGECSVLEQRLRDSVV